MCLIDRYTDDSRFQPGKSVRFGEAGVEILYSCLFVIPSNIVKSNKDRKRRKKMMLKLHI